MCSRFVSMRQSDKYLSFIVKNKKKEENLFSPYFTMYIIYKTFLCCHIPYAYIVT